MKYDSFLNIYCEKEEFIDRKKISNDESVDVNAARLLDGWAKNSHLEIIEGSDHSFGSKHPWESNKLPEAMQKAVNKSMDFILG